MTDETRPAASILVVALLAFSAFTGCKETPRPAKAPVPPKNPEEAIRACFTAYKKACLIDNDGKAAAAQVTASTFKTFERYRRLALDGTTDLTALDTIDLISVLALRIRSSRRELESATGRSLFEAGVKRGEIDKNQLMATDLDTIRVSGTRAEVTVRVANRALPMRYVFLFEDGSWKWDMAKFLEDTRKIGKKLLNLGGKGIERVDRLRSMLEKSMGRPIPRKVFEGPLK